MASFVISLNTIRFTGTVGLRTSSRCHEIASPSRSSSVARINSSTPLRWSLSFFTTFFLSFGMTYSGSKSFSTLIPSEDQGSFLYFSGTSFAEEGRSRMCPIDASTITSSGKYCLIVFVLVGDSTITSRFMALNSTFFLPTKRERGFPLRVRRVLPFR